MRQTFVRVVIFGFVIALSACGGGGSGTPPVAPPTTPPVNLAPTANAGPATQTAIVNGAKTLNGSASSDPEGALLTYQWSLPSRPAGSAVFVNGLTTATPSFTPDKEGDYQFRLVVSDGVNTSAPVFTTVTAAFDGGDIAAASNAHLQAIVNVANKTIDLQWNETQLLDNYRIEAFSDHENTGGYETMEIVPQLSGASPKRTYRHALRGVTHLRVSGTRQGRTVFLQTSNGDSAIHIDAPEDLRIVMDKPDPLTGPVQLSVEAVNPDATVRWQLDSDTVQVVGTGNPLVWNAFAATGPHVLSAEVNDGHGVITTVKRRVEISNGNFPVGITRVQRGANVHFYVSASSPFPITQVRASLDGGSVQTLTAKNSCGVMDCFMGQATQWEFVYPAQPLEFSLPLKPIPIVKAEATDSTGISSMATTQLITDPLVEITSGPPLGGFVSGMLQVQGTVDVVVGQTATVTGYLGLTKFFETAAASYSGSFDLTGVAAGNRTLAINATVPSGARGTVQRQVIVTSPALAHTPLFAIEDAAAILAAEGDLVLYRKSNQSLFVYNAGNGANVLLAPLYYQTGDLVLTADYVYGAGRGADADCKASDVCLYRWSTATGAVTNLSALDPNFPPSPAPNKRSAPRRAENFLVWQNLVTTTASARPFTIYNIGTGAFSVHAPTGGLVQPFFDVALTGATPVLVYVGATSVTAGAPASVYRWTQGSATAVVADLPAQAQPKWVGANTANIGWMYLPVDAFGGRMVLATAPVLGGSTTVRSTTALAVEVRNNAIMWKQANTDTGPPPGDTLVTATTGPTVLSPRGCPVSGQRLGAGGALVAFCAADGVRVWNTASGTSTLRVQGGPFPIFVTGNWMYFKSGESVYRVALT